MRIKYRLRQWGRRVGIQALIRESRWSFNSDSLELAYGYVTAALAITPIKAVDRYTQLTVTKPNIDALVLDIQRATEAIERNAMGERGALSEAFDYLTKERIEFESFLATQRGGILLPQEALPPFHSACMALISAMNDLMLDEERNDDLYFHRRLTPLCHEALEVYAAFAWYVKQPLPAWHPNI